MPTTYNVQDTNRFRGLARWHWKCTGLFRAPQRAIVEACRYKRKYISILYTSHKTYITTNLAYDWNLPGTSHTIVGVCPYSCIYTYSNRATYDNSACFLGVLWSCCGHCCCDDLITFSEANLTGISSRAPRACCWEHRFWSTVAGDSFRIPPRGIHDGATAGISSNSAFDSISGVNTFIMFIIFDYWDTGSTRCRVWTCWSSWGHYYRIIFSLDFLFFSSGKAEKNLLSGALREQKLRNA